MPNPEPGRPHSLGRKLDRVDASALLDIATACRTATGDDRSTAGRIRVVREALWFLWEKPRLPGPLVASKYPKAYPWSPRARASFEQARGRRPAGGWGLVLEHLYPREFLVGYLLRETRDVTDVLGVLNARLLAAVVTRADDRLLPTRKRSSGSWPDYATDPWTRYWDTELSVGTFRPLE